ncbi:MAG: ABC transporter [Yangia sp.]|nr:ABC transporter [Salipiger sp.]
MSGLLALLDDVAGIAKIAAASVDDISANAAKAGSKAVGVVIDDAAVTPKYVHGFEASRELPIIWKIARGSVFNKLIILLPAALLMAAYAPWLVPILLVMGGSYLCFEGAEKVLHVLMPHGAKAGAAEDAAAKGDPAHLEETKVKGAIKTDFILSAEIMTLALSTIEAPEVWIQAVVLALVGLGITALVYGAVALIVKADDVGLWLTQVGRLSVTRAIGRGIVKGMPYVMKILSTVGTAAMLWVGGSIIVHSLAQMGWSAPEEFIHHYAVIAEHAVSEQWQPAVLWLATATMDFILGLAWGMVLVPVVTRLVLPLFGGSKAAH